MLVIQWWEEDHAPFVVFVWFFFGVASEAVLFYEFVLLFIMYARTCV